MNKLLATALTASLALANPAWSDDAHHPDKAQEAAAPAKPPAPPTAKAEPAVEKMQANLKLMKGQLDRIAAAKTDAERRQAIAEHMQTMQDNMRLTRGMAGEMMGCPMMEGGMMMGGGMMGGGEMAKRMEQMEKRMDMMQMMLDRAAPRPEGSAPTR